MKRQDLKQLRQQSVKELRSEVDQARKKLVDLQLRNSLGKLKNTQAIKLLRRNIAQLLTILSEKEVMENA